MNRITADRANYRRFKIKTVVGQDDFAGMAEVAERRYSRLLHESGSRVRENAICPRFHKRGYGTCRFPISSSLTAARAS